MACCGPRRWVWACCGSASSRWPRPASRARRWSSSAASACWGRRRSSPWPTGSSWRSCRAWRQPTRSPSLTNHRGFQEVLAAELERARRSDGPLSLVMMDLDNFKTVNDTHGHPYGDEVLRAVGRSVAGSRPRQRHRRPGRRRGVRADPPRHRRRGRVPDRRAGARSGCGDLGPTTWRSPARRGSPPTRPTRRTPPASVRFADGALYWAKRQGKQRTRRFDPEHVASA